MLVAILEEDGFTACGYVKVQKSTLVNILNTAITYFVILLQFSLMSEPAAVK